jgi:hypothetical protein
MTVTATLPKENFGRWHNSETVLTDETVKVCAYDSSESAFLQAKQATIELTLRTI